MDSTTLEQLEQMRDESRALDRQTKSLPAFLSVTFLPILITICWVIFPEDSNGILFLGKLWIAGIVIGLMVCVYLASTLHQSLTFRHYWPALTCGLAVCVPPIVATASSTAFGYPLVQFSLTVGVTACGLGLFYYYRKTGIHKQNFTYHFFHAFAAFLVLYCQFEAGLGVALTFPRTDAGKILACAGYPFFTAIFRRLAVFISPSGGRLTTEILSVYFASMTYRILTIYYYKSWGVFFAILVIDIVFKWIFYGIQLTDRYLKVRKQVQMVAKRFSASLPSRFQKYIQLGEEEDSEEFFVLPLEKEREALHNDISLLFFLQTHADMYIGLGLAVIQLASMKLANHENCFSDWFSDFISITWKYGIVAVVQLVNVIVFYIFATKVMKKETFSPIREGTSSLATHHSKILFSNIALYFLVFILFFHTYSGKSIYCPENQ